MPQAGIAPVSPTDDVVGLAVPIKSGNTDLALSFVRALDTEHHKERARSARRHGIRHEVWYLLVLPTSDYLVAHIEGAGARNALRRISAPQDGFECWFREQLSSITGLDLNQSLFGIQVLETVSTFATTP